MMLHRWSLSFAAPGRRSLSRPVSHHRPAAGGPLSVILLVGAVLLLSLTAPPASEAQVGALRQDEPSPTAASLGEVGEVPVNRYTGQPDVSIPLYEVESRALTVPITLRYQGGGIQVEEVPGWVGTGWTLEAGGAITRTVRGLPDDHGSGGFLYTGSEIDDVWSAAGGSSVEDYLGDGTMDASLDSYRQKVENREADPEPDQFFFNVAGQAGKFVLGADGEARTMPYRKWDFDYETDAGGEIEQWTVTTEDGTKYVFGGTTSARELSYKSPDMAGGNWTSTWHLMRIESPTGEDEIEFFYSSSPREIRYENTEYARAQVFVGSTKSSPDGTQPRDTWVETRQLERIEAAGETVVVEAADRSGVALEDNSDPLPKLTSIAVQTPGGAETRRFAFDYTENSSHGGRLLLNQVQEKGAGGSPVKKPYEFSYYDEKTLPGRLSNRVDHWGYYNGKYNGSDRIPETTYKHDGDVAHYDGANREPSFPHMKAGVLTRIDYPTGGRTDLEWEPHDYTFIGAYKEVGYEETSKAASVGAPEPGVSQSTTFTVEDPEGSSRAISFAMDFDLDDPNGACSGGCVEGNVLDESGNVVHSHNPGTKESGSISYAHDLALEPGTYTLEAINREGGSAGNTVLKVGAEWTERVDVDKKPAAGYR